MEKNVLNTDLTGKVAVVTGASGTLCSIFSKALARGRHRQGLHLQRDEQGQLPAGSRECAGRPWPL